MILLYHRVAALGTDPWQMCVSPAHFSEHLEVLKKHFVPVTLEEMVDATLQSKPMKRWVAVTLDDGYRDSLENAQPLLDRHGVPATVFVTTGGLESDREFWWDELEKLLLLPGRLPAVLSVTVERKRFEWDLAPYADYRPADFEAHRPWRASGDRAPTRRHEVFRTLYDLMRPLPHEEKSRILTELQHCADLDGARRPTHRSLSVSELTALARKGCMQIGAHSVTHPLLSSLSIDVQKREVEESKAKLEEILGARIDGFAYPHGAFTAETARVVREAGYRYACCSRRDIVRPKADTFELPRVEVPDVAGERFDELVSVGLPRR